MTSTSPRAQLCAHCAFEDDLDAATHLEAWLSEEDHRPEAYRELLALLRHPSNARPPALHAYCGIGHRAGEAYASIYLNPGPELERA